MKNEDCNKNQEYYSKTKRCIKDKYSASLKKKIKSNKKVLSPFINKRSINIYKRIKYLIIMKKELKKYNINKKGCLKVYKENSNNKLNTYRIGNRIILKKRIGSDSVYGIVYLSEFREKEKKMFTFASKIYKYVGKKTTMEISILEKLTNIVIMDMCPHFPILYGYVICNKFKINNKDSFIKSNSKDKDISQKIEKYPELLKKNIKSKIITIFNELANGDLWNFIEININNSIMIINGYIQQLLSIMFFNYFTKRFHNDVHPGNFLYHKIKSGGYFHYELFGIDYYLENIGILWVIWDFDLSITLKEANNIYKKNKRFTNDYFMVTDNYLLLLNNNRIVNKNEKKEVIDFIFKIFNWSINKLKQENILDYIYNLPKILSDIKLNDKYILLKKLPKEAIIINKKPYVINIKNLFK